MLRKRIIFTLIYNQDFFMQSRNFRLQKVGDVSWLEKHYQLQKNSFFIDELIILDVSRSIKSIDSFSKTISRLANKVFIPVAAGGGIKTLEDAEKLFYHGADKIVLNTILFKDPETVVDLVNKYGSQSIVASIDYDKEQNVYIENGQTKINMSLQKYICHIEQLNVGEIYLNSMERDGTGFGYDFNVTEKLKDITTPLIIAGGAGNELHLIDGLRKNEISAVATANLFNFMGNGLENARKKIINAGINVAR